MTESRVRMCVAKNILWSATKIVLILMCLALIGLTAFGVTSEAAFTTMCSAVFGYYFGKSTTTAEKDLKDNEKKDDII